MKKNVKFTAQQIIDVMLAKQGGILRTGREPVAAKPQPPKKRV